jgi:hypothetical protein
MAADPASVPQTVWNALAGFIAGILGLLYASLGWSYTRQVKKNDDVAKKLEELAIKAESFAYAEDVASDYVRKQDFNSMEVRLASLASRRELVAYMREHKDQQQSQHLENKEVMKALTAASERRDAHAQEFRKEMRDNLHQLALKVEFVSTIQKAQGAPGSS